MTLYKWSQTAASNGTADGSCPWPEGMAPSAVNDSARGGMAAVAKHRDDIAGAIVTGGTSTAYTVASYQVFDTLAHLSGQMIAFTPHATNGATVTLNVDSLGAKPLRTSPGVELLAGTIIQGTPYTAVYNNSDGAFYLQAFYGNPALTPYLIPIGSGLPFFMTAVPNSNFAFPFGQAVSRSTYATLFAGMGTAFGVGDGSTTFNLPDLRGRTPSGKDDMGGVAASRLTNAGSGITGTNLGAAGGAETVTLLATNLPPQTPAGAVNLSSVGSTFALTNGVNAAGGGASSAAITGTTSVSASFVGTPFAGQNSTPVNKVAPTIIVNYIIRII